ncbi:hypothetical protein C9F11_10320 [Streptomyces sp. YIM 121038]|uniref:helix-turn-helix domain-containing protein n=1 Tax=Streptomyces sp. YIM 121038 TaxID=2136401 RepID=UPI001110D8CC|nr:helix-turn-helix transcriptional regulator [Streptomyces sp. YIM 121038]QCX75744.1 hypothetical protein C9F11_10320 [Streptomyces sp. YIM 121038]
MDLEQASQDEVSPRCRFGETLKEMRKRGALGPLSQTETARRVRTSKSTISRMESGQGPIPPDLPARLDEAFSTDGVFKALYEEIRVGGFPAIYQRRMDLEREAIAIWEWSPTVVPGLLQTGGYARAILRKGDPRATDDEVYANVGKRLARQDALRGAVPPELRVVLCESVVRRAPCPSQDMRDQLASLLSHARQPTTRIQVLPLDAEAHLLIDGAISLLTSPNHVTVACVEAYRTATIIEDPEHVRAATRAYDELTGEALSRRASADLIRELMERL